MSGSQSNRQPTGADLIGFEDEREVKAMLVASLRARQAALELELTNLAGKLCLDIEAQLAVIEKELDR